MVATLWVVAAAWPAHAQQRSAPLPAGCSALPTCPTAQTRPSAWGVCACGTAGVTRSVHPSSSWCTAVAGGLATKPWARMQEKVNRWVWRLHPHLCQLLHAALLPLCRFRPAMCRLPWWRRSSASTWAGTPGPLHPHGPSGRRPSGGLAQRPRRRPSAKGGAVAGRRGARQCRDERARRHSARGTCGCMTMRLAATRPLGCAVGPCSTRWTVGAPAADGVLHPARRPALHPGRRHGPPRAQPGRPRRSAAQARATARSMPGWAWTATVTRAVETFMGSLDAEVARHLQ